MIQGFLRDQFSGFASRYDKLIVNSLAIIVASIPIALPLVMHVSMAIGIKDLARVHRAVVTSIPALQDVASMSVLCSDKVREKDRGGESESESDAANAAHYFSVECCSLVLTII